jgi:hypothetical protein
LKDIREISIHLDFCGPAMVGLGLHQEPVHRVPGLNEATWEISKGQGKEHAIYGLDGGFDGNR